MTSRTENPNNTSSTSTAVLFLLPALIWGSTFFVIKFQLGKVDPTWSMSYRFILAGLILLAYAKLTGLNLSFSKKQHGHILTVSAP